MNAPPMSRYAPKTNSYSRDTYAYNGQVMMSDWEVLHLPWFRGEQYQNFFKFMDSHDGFQRFGWGNAVFRTMAVLSHGVNVGTTPSGLFPYAHQAIVFCPEGRRALHLGHFWYGCSDISISDDPDIQAIDVSNKAEQQRKERLVASAATHASALDFRDKMGIDNADVSSFKRGGGII